MPVYFLREEPFSNHFHGIRPFVRQCGNDRRNRWALRNRCLLDYLLVFIKEGTGVFSLGNRSWVVKEGDLFWVPPNVPCSMDSRSDSMVCPFIHFDLMYRNPESHWFFSIPENTVDLSKWESLLHPPLPQSSVFSELPGVFHPSQGAYICRLIEEICHDSALMRPFHQVEQSGRMYLLLSAVLRDFLCDSQVDDVLAGRLHRLPEYLRDNMACATVASCADFCCLSESYFRKVFTRFYGTSPQEYLNKMRMRFATELMTDTSLSITAISSACGYLNPQNFSRMFAKTMGLSPRDYRRGVQR
jgi:AraC-like DNA-binding protein